MDESQITTESVMADYVPPEESTTRRRRGRQRTQPETESESTDTDTPKRTRAAKKVSNPAAIRKDFNALIARMLVMVGAAPESVYAEPPDTELEDPTYTKQLQPYLLPVSAAERIAKLTDKVNAATEGKIEKVKNSKLGIGWSALMAFIEMAKTLTDLGKLVASIKAENAQNGTQSDNQETPNTPG